MKESGYYPAGAEFDPDAPFNEPDIPSISVDVCASYTLSKPFTIEVEDYFPVYERGSKNIKTMTPNFDNTNFEREFLENADEVLGIPALLSFLVKLASEKLDKLKNRADYKSRMECKRLKGIISSAKGWVTDDFTVVKE